MILPRLGDFYALEFTHSDTEIFQAFLDNANKDMNLKRKRNLIICDNAAWHKAKKIDWVRFEPVFLPPYSHDLNLIERLWLLIKAEWFSDFIARDYENSSSESIRLYSGPSITNSKTPSLALLRINFRETL